MIKLQHGRCNTEGTDSCAIPVEEGLPTTETCGETADRGNQRWRQGACRPLRDSCRHSIITRDFRPGLSDAAASRLELLIVSIDVFKSKKTAGLKP
jgi:hypothetical protein